jgi:ketosteroid isomerase-like protein
MKRRVAIVGLAVLVAGCAAPVQRGSVETLIQDVTAAELAFAKTMADRDHAAFLNFVSDEAVFINGGKPLRGRAAVGEHWKRFYTEAAAPFSWKPDLVQVLDSGTLALSIGPVALPDGKVVARFYSTWRLEGDSRWRVVFDNGYNVCDCTKAP